MVPSFSTLASVILVQNYHGNICKMVSFYQIFVLTLLKVVLYDSVSMHDPIICY